MPVVPAWGSPPLARGRQRRHLRRGDQGGITPARAGTAPSTTSSPGATADHPRSRGDGLQRHPERVREAGSPRSRGDGTAVVIAATSAAGSPPLARGRHDGRAVGGGRLRITPARAGTATSPTPGPRVRTDHPRSRGDGAAMASTTRPIGGSPPLARGRPRLLLRPTLGGGITPARAGTAWRRRTLRWRTRDHPRSRGDGANWRSLENGRLGSPPLARGRPMVTTSDNPGPWITPARAGTALRGRSSAWGSWDHPRSRGDGASGCCWVMNVPGITPARAGTAQPSPGSVSLTPDHPRSRGDGRGTNRRW